MSKEVVFKGLIIDSVDGEVIEVSTTENGGSYDVGFYHGGRLLCSFWTDQLEHMIAAYKESLDD